MYNSFRHRIILLISVLFVGLALHGSNVLWAAPTSASLHQTIPIPTATPENTPVPTATPSDDDIDIGTATPTPTPLGGIIDDSQDADGEEDVMENGVVEDGVAGDIVGDVVEDVAGESHEGGDDSSQNNDAPSNDTGDTPSSNDGSTTSGNEGSRGGAAADAPAETTAQTTAQNAKVAPIVLNVRSGPSTDNGVMGTVFQDDSVQVIGRSGLWWLVCCAFGFDEPGWVDSQFLLPAFDIESADALIPEIVIDGADGTPTNGNNSGAGGSTAAENDSLLVFQISHEPAFVWPGQQLDMTFTVTNTGADSVENIRIRDDFPAGVTVAEVGAMTNGEAGLSESNAGTTILVATWPTLASSQSHSLTIRLVIDDTVEAGTIINNLAVVSASNASDVTAGISMGMPPARLPSFR